MNYNQANGNNEMENRLHNYLHQTEKQVGKKSLLLMLPFRIYFEMEYSKGEVPFHVVNSNEEDFPRDRWYSRLM